MTNSAIVRAIETLAACEVPAVRLHAARTLGSPRRFGPLRALRAEAERDMFARDVRELFLAPHVQASSTGRLRGSAADVLGRVLSCNASVALDALLARGCNEPGRAVDCVLMGMLARSHRRGFFFEPRQKGEAERLAGRPAEACFLPATAAYCRYLVAFGHGRDARVRRAFEWMLEYQEADGTWRAPPKECRDGTESYARTRLVAEAVAELPVTALKRWAGERQRLATGWADRILATCDEPDAVLPSANLAPERRGSRDPAAADESLRSRLLYFPLEDLWLALRLGASPRHPHLAPWIAWVEASQQADGSWRLHNPGLRERLLLSDPNGRLRAEALFLSDEWITLRAAQILRMARRATRAPRSGVPESVAAA